MKLIINRVDIGGSTVMATLSHGDKLIHWSYSTFKRGNNNRNFEEYDLFQELNQYWETLPESRIQEIFNQYVLIKETLGRSEHYRAKNQALATQIKRMLDLHPLEEIDHWIRFKTTIEIPDNVKESFEDSHTNPGTAERTYLREDYRWLLAMALNLRVMVPIWGEYINITSETYGNVWKEYQAYQLLNRTAIWNSIPMQKLRVWALASLPAEKMQRSAVLEGIGMEDFNEWLVGMLVVRRVSVGELRNPDPKATIASSIWNYVFNLRTTGIDAAFMDHIRDKPLDNGPEGEKNSRLENYKIRQELPEGDVAMLTHYPKDTWRLAQRVSPAIKREIYDASMESVKALMSEQTHDAQLIIMQLVLNEAIPAKALPHFPRDVFVACAGVAQAVLWQKGHHDLAALVSARAETSTGTTTRVSRIGHNRIKANVIEQLEKLYPYPYRTNSKSKDPKEINAAQTSINFLSDKIDMFAWRLTLPDPWVKIVNQTHGSRRYNVPQDIRTKIAMLAIDIANRSL